MKIISVRGFRIDAGGLFDQRSSVMLRLPLPDLASRNYSRRPSTGIARPTALTHIAFMGGLERAHYLSVELDSTLLWEKFGAWDTEPPSISPRRQTQ